MRFMHCLPPCPGQRKRQVWQSRKTRVGAAVEGGLLGLASRLTGLHLGMGEIRASGAGFRLSA